MRSVQKNNTINIQGKKKPNKIVSASELNNQESLLVCTVTEMNPNVVVISVLAILSILLIGLLLVTLVVLRRKHLQMAR